jgi:hypothetical protein
MHMICRHGIAATIVMAAGLAEELGAVTRYRRVDG